MFSISTLRALLILFILLVAPVLHAQTGPDTLKLTQQLNSMARQLEHSLTADRSKLPVWDVVKDFGAINDGMQLTTSQLQKAIDSCARSGAGRLFFPEGIYLTGTLILRSGVHLELSEHAKILGSTNEKDYLEINPAYKNNTDRQVDKSLLYAEKVNGISLTGKGTIDFQGTAPVYLHTGNNDPRRPFGIRFVSCQNIYVSGLLLLNSPQWLQHYLDCENLMVENINVFNHAHQNNDGIDIDGCRNVYMRNCRVDSDDDAICLKSNGPSPCENVLIENCIASSHCNALKLGTETTGGFRNIIYRNCKVVPSVTGLHFVNGTSTTQTAITLIITDGGLMENVWFDHIEAENCVTPIFVTLGNRSRKHTEGVPTPGIGTMRNIRLSNIKATGAGPNTSSVTGLDTAYCIQNIVLENISIELTHPGTAETWKIDMKKLLQKKKPLYPSPHVWGPLPSYGLYCRYVTGLRLINVQFRLNCQDPRESLLLEDCKDVKQSGPERRK